MSKASLRSLSPSGSSSLGSAGSLLSGTESQSVSLSLVSGDDNPSESLSSTTEQEAKPRVMTGVEFEKVCRQEKQNVVPVPQQHKSKKKRRMKTPVSRRQTQVTKMYTTPRTQTYKQPSLQNSQPELKSTVSKALAQRNVLQRRHLPQHVHEQGNVERYYMDLNHALNERKALEEAVGELRSKMAETEAKHTRQQRQTEELLHASAAISGNKNSDRRKQLLTEQQALQELKEAMRVLGEQIGSKKTELNRVKQVSKATHVKELERRVKVYFVEMEQLQRQIEEADADPLLNKSREELRESQSLLKYKEEMMEKAENKLGMLRKQELELQRGMETLKNELIKEHQDTGELHLKLGEERQKLSHDVNKVPLELERTRAEVQAAEAQKIITDANFERAKYQFQLSMTQLEASEADMQGKVERYKAKKEAQDTRLKEVTTILQDTRDDLAKAEQELVRKHDTLQTEVQKRLAEREQEIVRAHEEKMKQIAEEKENLEHEIREEDDRAELQRNRQEAELEDITLSYDERQKMLLERLPVKTYTAPKAQGTNEQKRIQQLEDEKDMLTKELAILKRAERTEYTVKVECSSPVFEDEDSSQLSEDSPRAETSSEVTRVQADQHGDDEDEGAESLCRGAGGTYLGKGSDSEDE